MKYSKILKFDEFISESLSEWGFSGYGLDGGVTVATDMGLNANAYHMQKTEMEDQMQRLQGILKNIFSATQAYGSSHFDFGIKDLTVVRIFPNNNNSLDVYLKFILDEGIYYATFKNWASFSGSKFESPVLNHPQIKRHLENAIKLEGLLKQALNKWFRPETGEYRSLKQIKVYDEMGNIFMIPENGKVIVDEVLSEEDKPIIYLTYSDRKYFLTDLDYYFFHWWFTPKEKKKYYI